MAAFPNANILGRPQRGVCGNNANDTFVGDFGATNEVSVTNDVLVIGDSY